MKIALYHRHIEPADLPAYTRLEQALAERGVEAVAVVDGCLPDGCDFLFSIGGDGTLLSSLQLVDTGRPDEFPPVVGVNFGHLGFLTTAGRDSIEALADSLLQGRYVIERRTLLQAAPPAPTPFALNEVFLHRAEHTSLLRTEVWVDGNYVATYAADGVIVATPTGSTAYSLSCGGPILTPDSRCLALTPISAHTLTLRPIILPDSAVVELRVDSECCLGIDSTHGRLAAGDRLALRRAPFTLRLVRIGEQTFFTAIRDKLMWGTGAAVR
ncbi:MAG: NAD(+)/NADH kinase [Bacteroidales bacterium]|nr:NAD(+)/NADH kinase [Bacteroidales bacterium]